MTRRWLLDQFRISDIIKSKANFEDLVEFHWMNYSELAFQRNRIRDKLSSALREKGYGCGPCSRLAIPTDGVTRKFSPSRFARLTCLTARSACSQGQQRTDRAGK